MTVRMIGPAPAAAVTAATLGLGTADTPNFTAVKLNGLSPGSTLRFVGRHTSAGAPGSGTWQLGDVMVDLNGVLWLCTAAGTPGTWSYAVPSHGSAHAPGSSDAAVVAANSIITSDQTNATTTPADITGLGLTVPSSGVWDFYFHLPWSSDSTGNGINLRLKSSGAPTVTTVPHSIRIQNTTTTHNTWYATTFATAQSTGTAGATGTSYTAEIWGRAVATTSGVLIPQFAIGGGGAATATLRAGARGRLMKVGT